MSWVCMDCGNEAGFSVVHYEVTPATQTAEGMDPFISEDRILQMGCGSCQSIRVGMKSAEGVTPGRWVKTAERAASSGPSTDSGNVPEIEQEIIDEIAPSLGVPEGKGADGSLQWDLENPVAGTKALVAYDPEKRVASVYVRSGNAFIGYTALEPVSDIFTDLDEGEVEFVANGMTLAVTADGVFFVRPATPLRDSSLRSE